MRRGGGIWASCQAGAGRTVGACAQCGCAARTRTPARAPHLEDPEQRGREGEHEEAECPPFDLGLHRFVPLDVALQHADVVTASVCRAGHELCDVELSAPVLPLGSFQSAPGCARSPRTFRGTRQTRTLSWLLRARKRTRDPRRLPVGVTLDRRAVAMRSACRRAWKSTQAHA